MRAVLYRHHADDERTLGVLTFDASHRPVYTLEPPWKDNEHNVSCIPPGEYQVIRNDTPEHPHSWRLLGVPDRSGILIHPGNEAKDTRGCILPGLWQTLSGVHNSADAMRVIREAVGEAGTFTLRVANQENIR